MRFLPLSFALLGLQMYAANPVIFGVRGGVPFTANNNNSAFSNSLRNFAPTQRFAVGPTLGVRLPLNFSVEGDALYTRQTLSTPSIAGLNASTHSDAWEFPVMLKYAIGRSSFTPVIGAGVSARHVNDFGSLGSYLLNGTNANSFGFVAGGGVRFNFGAVQVTPEIRYTRWTGDSWTRSLLSALPFEQNAASVLVGITF